MSRLRAIFCKNHPVRRKEAGFTLVEVLVAVGILALVLVGIMQLLIYCSRLAAISGNMTLAMAEAQSKLEEIRNHHYNSIVTDYSSSGTPGNTFVPAAVNGMGVIYIDNSNPDLLDIKVVVSWQDEDGRVIGEDTNLNGVLDGGEDLNGNGQLDSIVTLRALLAKRV